MTKQKIMSCLFLGALLLMILACGRSGISENDAMKQLSKWTIDTWMAPPPDKPVSLILMEEGNTRHLFLRYRKKSHPLGSLRRQIGPEIPVETMFLNIDGNRFIVFWVNDDLTDKARSIMIYRPDPDFPDQPGKSNEAKIVEVDKNGMAVVPIFTRETHDWSYLDEIVITSLTAADDFLFEKTFDPALPISHLFQQVSLPKD